VSNRRALDESLASMFAMMHRYEHPFSIVILDIDHFKKINDECGHLHGDRKLRDVAGLLDETVRETDIVARYGGEEFVIVLPHTDLEGACVFGERLRRLIHDQLSLTISGGVTAAVDGDSVETLMNRADEALYSAKAAGRNRVYQHDATDIRSVTEAADCDDAAEEVSAAS